MKNLRDFFRSNPVKDLYTIWRKDTYGTKGPSGFDSYEDIGAKKFANYLATLYRKFPPPPLN